MCPAAAAWRASSVLSERRILTIEVCSTRKLREFEGYGGQKWGGLRYHDDLEAV